MAVSVKKISLWRSEVANRPGSLAGALAALAEAGADLRVVMAYRFPGDETRGAVELYPVTGKRAQSAARSAGLSESGIPTLLVEGEDRPGIGSAISRAIAEAGINLAFFVAQVIGRRYSAVIGFDSEADAKKAAPLVKRAKPAKK
ncbi:MAG TPA: hypothetical protein VGQ75_10075 [Thermoanaerobaculia bacterium]|jgi:hypothetical protein|nr:hypothetical protein [Thermoanaerobaculia bacterium]HEV8608807.1 hypothetical protein [Thermoanaerobaculia bacterium]